MRKLLKYLDNTVLNWGVIFASLFIVLYPKLPSIHITHTWVYIRLEDFVIGFITLLWLVQVLRRKVKIPFMLGIPIILYWIVGAVSLIYSLLYIGPNLTNFFPSVATLEYLRRIEYMILFFVGYGSIISAKDLKNFVRFLFIGMGAIILYGLGQHFYPYFWKYLPEAMQKTNFCFPSFQTGNEEFAKGIPLCLPVGSRVTSTFGGHYDLAGYLLVTLPIVLGAWMIVKKKTRKVLLGILYVTGVITLILTSSRIAFGAYIFAVIPPLILLKKKRWIVPVIALSFVCLVLFSESTIHRFAQTFRLTSVVVNMQGQVVGTTENGLTDEQKRQLALGGNAIAGNQIIQGEIPEGSSFITLPQQRIATNTAVIKHNLTAKEAQQLALANGGLEISTLKGNFSVQRALVYDISVTTRLQGEWPHALAAFLSYPILGKGYSTLTLAVDNDYLRLLGESGLLGFISFLGIFIVFVVYLRQALPRVEDKISQIFIIGLVGGVIGLFVNAALFDIFEASKVAESLWLFLGIGMGAVALGQKKPVSYLQPLLKIATAPFSLGSYLLIVTFAAFWSSLGQFFIGDDFVWLKWAASSTFADVSKYFLDAGGFFYRPLDKMLMLFFYAIFSFQQQGYHAIILFIHAGVGIGVFILATHIFKKKSWAFLAALLFIMLPIHAENIFWISSLSIDLSALLMVWGVVSYIKSQEKATWIFYPLTILFSILSLLSYELALIFPLLLTGTDLVLLKKSFTNKLFLRIIPFFILDGIYEVIRLHAHALTQSGDYSYSLPHLIPNIFGNVFGYLGLFIIGEKFLPIYALLRMDLKAFALPLGIILAVLIGVGVYAVWKNKLLKKLHAFQSVSMYALFWIVVGLLPYLALGNMAERYGYFASIGFVILIAGLVKMIYTKLQKRFDIYTKFVAGVVLAVIFIFCIWANRIAMQEWQTASKITYNTLGFFKIETTLQQTGKTFYVANLPIRRANAWIFPTGFAEGLWFLYRDQSPTVILLNDVEIARSLLTKNIHTSNAYTFDSNYQIYQIFPWEK